MTLPHAFDLAHEHHRAGRLADAEAIYRQILALQPKHAEALHFLGVIAHQSGRHVLAVDLIRQAIALTPNNPAAHSNLGEAYRTMSRLDEAIASYRRAIELQPDYSQTHDNLGNALRDRGQLDEAIASYRRALELEPERAGAHSNLVFALHLHPGHDGRSISEEQRRWNRRFSDPLKSYLQPHANERSPERRLRIGYVSPDFRDHAVGRCLLPLFERHDRERFEILCYSGVTRPDWVTERLRARAGKWRSTVGVPDDRLAETIREDAADILVDLSLHTAGNRLPVFARQSAPVQVAWLAYPGSTGLPGIGYRLTDACMDPPGEKPAWSSEEPVRLPGCWCCYQPADETPEINGLPALSARGVTFGSLNNFAKMHDGPLALWARVLEAVNGSRLLMLCPEGSARDRVRAFFDARGIAAERIELARIAPRREYLALYHQIDIGLDPFPYNGMATTCDALWMGVPVLTLPGVTPASRAGFSLLSSIGLGELAAQTEEDFVRMAVELAGDIPRLADLRATLRRRMLASPLMDAPRFAQNVEAAYRSMWRAWCKGKV
jgi:predicted O-linked N-acetylglucosamine transferase (SPINDLY family)